jgi:hypothetical protein
MPRKGAVSLDNLAHVHPCACAQAKLVGSCLDALGCPDGVDRPFEDRHELVPGVINEAATVCVDSSLSGVSVDRKQVGPSLVSERVRQLRRSLEVAEKDRPHDARLERLWSDTGDEMLDFRRQRLGVSQPG